MHRRADGVQTELRTDRQTDRVNCRGASFLKIKKPFTIPPSPIPPPPLPPPPFTDKIIYLKMYINLRTYSAIII